MIHPSNLIIGQFFWLYLDHTSEVSEPLQHQRGQLLVQCIVQRVWEPRPLQDDILGRKGRQAGWCGGMLSISRARTWGLTAGWENIFVNLSQNQKWWILWKYIKNGHLLQTKKQMSWRFHPRDVDVKNRKRHTDDDEHKDVNTLAVAVGEVKEESQNNERSTNLKKTSKKTSKNVKILPRWCTRSTSPR